MTRTALLALRQAESLWQQEQAARVPIEGSA
jgi:hypothetical protein